MTEHTDKNGRSKGLFGGVWSRLKGALGGDAEGEASAAPGPATPRGTESFPEGSELSTGTYDNRKWREEELATAPQALGQAKSAHTAPPPPPAPPVAQPANTVDGFFGEFDFLEDTAVDGVEAARPPSPKSEPQAPAAPTPPTKRASAQPDDGVGTVTSDTVFSQFNWQDEDEEEKPNER